ncbi:hypothetical protein [Bacillus massiliglaciei]|uniref:hypothetical protein n=1 Tax=Bacillus massiliglaciei TaxID=1816693 RepID=UPI000DA630C5|nr:hypothetical protein [Bacillus massiliglaciei]
MLTAEYYGEMIAITKDMIEGQTQLDAINGWKKDEEWYEKQRKKIDRYERKISKMKGRLE